MITILEGWLIEAAHGDAYDVLYLTANKGKRNEEDPLAAQLQELKGKVVTVRYWICQEKITKEAIAYKIGEALLDKMDVDFNHTYSELTGYLWTTENLKIGGHDLLKELRSFTGAYCILEIEIHNG